MRTAVTAMVVATVAIAAVWLAPIAVDRPQPPADSATAVVPTPPSPRHVDSPASPATDSASVVPQGVPEQRHAEPRRAVVTPPSRGRASPDRADRQERPERNQTAALTVASEPYGVLYIDDLEIGDTPVANRQLEVGRTYRIRVEREGYKTRRETITVSGPNPIRRNYILDPGGAP